MTGRLFRGVSGSLVFVETPCRGATALEVVSGVGGGQGVSTQGCQVGLAAVQ